jgi:katanin p60 ATPase-containing subunit A1
MRGLELEETVNFQPIVKATNGFSGADMSNLCREAAMMPLRRRLNASGININEIE